MEEAPKKEQPNVMAIISYIGFLCLIPIFSKEKDEFVRFHAKQGLVLFAGELAGWAVFSLLPFLWYFAGILNILWLVLTILGIMNVVNKEKKELPLLGRFADKLAALIKF
jgi:uncharacterized membrane protein